MDTESTDFSSKDSDKGRAGIQSVEVGFTLLDVLAQRARAEQRAEASVTALTLAAGLGIGGISALVAIGGGSLSVPFMTWCNVKVHQAIGTSAAICSGLHWLFK